jgi:hypothetical protein
METWFQKNPKNGKQWFVTGFMSIWGSEILVWHLKTYPNSLIITSFRKMSFHCLVIQSFLIGFSHLNILKE